MDERFGFELYQSGGNRGSVGRVSVLRRCGCEWVGFLDGGVVLFLWQMQTSLRRVGGTGLVSASPAFMRSNASHPADPHSRLAKKTR